MKESNLINENQIRNITIFILFGIVAYLSGVEMAFSFFIGALLAGALGYFIVIVYNKVFHKKDDVQN